MHSTVLPLKASSSFASSGSFDESLSAAQARVPGAAEAFLAAHGSWVERTAKALCRRFGVPEQDHEDAVQETYRRLLDPHLRQFRPGCGEGRQYVRGVILNAIDFGGRRRQSAREGSARDCDKPMDTVDNGWQEPFHRVEARQDLSKLLRGADVLVCRAFGLVCAKGLSQREAANAVGVSEFKLSRAIGKASSLARLAA
jgi:DNA-directed RNA polymerase specialized sigma24 family protein